MRPDVAFVVGALFGAVVVLVCVVRPQWEETLEALQFGWREKFRADAAELALKLALKRAAMSELQREDALG